MVYIAYAEWIITVSRWPNIVECGKRLSKAKGKCTVYNCSDYHDQLQACFGVDVSHDSKSVHPPK